MSRFDALTSRAPSPSPEPEPPAARRNNPEYRQFSAYVPAPLYRKLKVRIAERETELSIVLEEAIADWLKKST